MTDETTHIWNDFHKELKAYIAKTIHNQVDADDVVLFISGYTLILYVMSIMV